jgi:hypothetical protein
MKAVVRTYKLFTSLDQGCHTKNTTLGIFCRFCWKILENVGKRWKTLENVGKRWKTLENVGKCWKMLENVGKCWKMLRHFGIFITIWHILCLFGFVDIWYIIPLLVFFTQKIWQPLPEAQTVRRMQISKRGLKF